MGELMKLIQLLWSGVCWMANLLAVPFAILLGVMFIAGCIVLGVCLDREVQKDREQRMANQQ